MNYNKIVISFGRTKEAILYFDCVIPVYFSGGCINLTKANMPPGVIMPQMSNQTMRTVSFINTETEDDLIVFFALCVADDPTEVDSLTLLRTKFEVFLEEPERGVKVSLELEEKGLLKEVAFDRNAAVVHLRTSECSFEVDLRTVASVEIEDMLKVLELMNFDGRIAISLQ